jgi:hypothetical protein
MSGDREARALGAGETIEVNGSEYTLRPVGVGYLTELRREALKSYKRQYLETFSENKDLLSDGEYERLIKEEMVKIARWTLEDLPKKVAHDASGIPVTKKLRRWVEEEFDETPEEEDTVRAYVAFALDDGRLTGAEVKRMTGQTPVKGVVSYDQWWVTGEESGMVSFIHRSIRREHPEVTKEQIADWPAGKIREAARAVESLTAASMGNG